jgi:hypothetical protein
MPDNDRAEPQMQQLTDSGPCGATPAACELYGEF